jgi:hypothetical protein
MNKKGGTMLYIGIAAIVILAGVLFWQYLENGKLRVKIKSNEIIQNTLDLDGMKRQAKMEFMIRELNKVYEGSKQRTYCLGNIDALKWAVGLTPDDQYWGWVMARKQAVKGEK